MAKSLLTLFGLIITALFCANTSTLASGLPTHRLHTQLLVTPAPQIQHYAPPSADLVTPIAASIAALAAAAALWTNRRTSMIVMQASTLRDFKADFDKLAHARYVAAKYALARINDESLPISTPPEVWQVMDFFDKLSLYLKRNYLDSKMTYVALFYWMYPYWIYFEPEVTSAKLSAPLAMWDEIPLQVARLSRVAGRAFGIDDDKLRRAREGIADFFTMEIEECRPKQMR